MNEAETRAEHIDPALKDTGWFSIVDIMQVPTQQPDILAFPSAPSAPPRDPKSCFHAETRRPRRMTKQFFSPREHLPRGSNGTR